MGNLPPTVVIARKDIVAVPRLWEPSSARRATSSTLVGYRRAGSTGGRGPVAAVRGGDVRRDQARVSLLGNPRGLRREAGGEGRDRRIVSPVWAVVS